MRESHANKSISFLMELIFVLFLFTLASAVCVLVLGTARDKNNLAADTRNALQYGENLVAQRKIPQVQQAMRRKSFTWMRMETGHLRRQDIIGSKLNRRKRLKKWSGTL
ncbi:MAG: hypothetical protein ACLRL6_15085 [Clostridium sp.]